MKSITTKRLQGYQTETFRWASRNRLRTMEEGIQYVNERGFVYFWPIKGIHFPSLWAAVAGDRPVASAHDDPGHVTWGWKDELLDKKKWYYAKVLRGKATMISLESAPFFYALSKNYGEPESDYLEQYRDGNLSQPAKLIFEALLEGQLDTVTLRRKIHMTSKASNSPFERGLVELQRDFKILPVGVARTGGWRYSFIYQPVHTYYPELPNAARQITEIQARCHLIRTQVRALGVVEERDIARLFQWPNKIVRPMLQKLVEDQSIVPDVKIKGQPGDFYAWPALVG